MCWFLDNEFKKKLMEANHVAISFLRQLFQKVFHIATGMKLASAFFKFASNETGS